MTRGQKRLINYRYRPKRKKTHFPPEFRRIALRSEDMSERREMGLLMLALRTGIEPFEITPKSLGIEGSLFGVLNFVLNIKCLTQQNLGNP